MTPRPPTGFVVLSIVDGLGVVALATRSSKPFRTAQTMAACRWGAQFVANAIDGVAGWSSGLRPLRGNLGMSRPGRTA